MALCRGLWEKYGGQCCYCRCRLRVSEATVDHFYPRARGGKNNIGNLRLACAACNGAKADMHPKEWLRLHPPPPPNPSRQEARAELRAQIAMKYRERYGADR